MSTTRIKTAWPVSMVLCWVPSVFFFVVMFFMPGLEGASGADMAVMFILPVVIVCSVIAAFITRYCLRQWRATRSPDFTHTRGAGTPGDGFTSTGMVLLGLLGWGIASFMHGKEPFLVASGITLAVMLVAAVFLYAKSVTSWYYVLLGLVISLSFNIAAFVSWA